MPSNRSKQYNKNHQEQEIAVAPNINELSIGNSRTIPKRKVSVQTLTCVNHGETEAEFKISIDGESLNYCSKCAAHLASNGFKVERMVAARSP